MTEKPFAPATERNAQPILEVLRREFRACQSVLEIGSGTGQHAVSFAAEMEHLTWQTSDRDENHPGIHAWIDEASLENVRRPLSLDVLIAPTLNETYDAVYSANTAHIMSYAAVEKMFGIVGHVLPDTGVFCLYGPFRQNGTFNTPSNEEFDRSLRGRDPAMGIRDLEDLDGLANDDGMFRARLYAMPANNHLAVWIKGSMGVSDGPA